MAHTVGFVVLFIGFWLLCLFVGAFIRKLVGLSGLGFVDRLGGFIAGGAKVFLILSALLAVLMRMNFIGEVIKPVIGNSTAYNMLLNTGAWVLNLDVNEINKKLNEHFDTKENSENIEPKSEVSEPSKDIESENAKPNIEPNADDSSQDKNSAKVEDEGHLQEPTNSENNSEIDYKEK